MKVLDRGVNRAEVLGHGWPIFAAMDATVRFYHGMLGARLAATVGTPEFRHYFFDFGPHCTVAFFEYADLEFEPLAKPPAFSTPVQSSSTTSHSTCE